MGRPQKVDIAKLREMHANGMRAVDIAKHFGVGKSAITWHFKHLKLAATKNVIVEQAPKFVKDKLDAIEQLGHINEVVNRVLDELTGEEQTTKRMVQAVQSVLDYEKEPTKDNLKNLKAIILRINQDKNTAIKACAEIRGQVGLYFDIKKTLHDIKVVAEYHQVLIETLRATSPALRDDFLARMQERDGLERALRAKPVKSLEED